MNYLLEPYAESLNFLLPSLVFLGGLLYLASRLYLIMWVTPRLDQINGYTPTRQFKVNLHQAKVYQRHFKNGDPEKKGLFKMDENNLWIFHSEIYLARSMLILVPLNCSFLTYTQALMV